MDEHAQWWNDDDMRRRSIKRLAEEHGWSFVQNLGKHVGHGWRFNKITDKDHVIIDVWPSTMKVGTTLTHPKKGRNTMFRTGVNRRVMEKLFKNPRQHTTGGYRTKNDPQYGKDTELRS